PREPGALLAGSGLAGAYFDSTNLTHKDFARIDPTINFTWSQSPTGSNPFAVRWSGRVEPKFTDTYHFSLISSGSIRLWVDNQLVINRWDGHSTQTDAANVALKGGQRYDIRIEYAHH